MLRFITAAVIGCALALAGTAVDAKPKRQQQAIIKCDDRFGCAPVVQSHSARRHPSGGVSWNGRPSECPVRLWCGCWARIDAGLSDIRLNVALNWPKLLHVVGRRGSTPIIGSYAVMYRKGGGHVGRVTGIDADGNPIIKSGNHNNRVAEAAYPRSRVIAYVQP